MSRAPRTNRRELLRLGAAGAIVPPGTLARALAMPRQELTVAGFLAAVAAGDLESATRHLDHDPDFIRSRDEQDRSALTIALLADAPEIATLLRARGYAPDLVEAAFVGDWGRFDELAAPAPLAVNRDHPLGGTAMYAAARGGAGADMWRVYRYHGDPNASPRGRDGFTPLRAALEVPDLAVAEITMATMLSNGADPDAPQADGSSPLHAAARRGSLEAVEYLLRKDADVDARDVAGRRPVELADDQGHREVVRMLETHERIPRDHSTSRTAYNVEGAPYRPPGLDGIDPMRRERMVGQSHGNLDAVRELAAAEPDLVHSVASTTERAVEACAHTGRLAVVDFLLERGAAYALPTAVVRGDLARARALLDEDPLRINERGAHDFALLWYPAIGGGRLDLAELLLERGADIEWHHFLGTTALHLAVSRGQLDLIALLIDHGANVERVGRKFVADGETPLQLAARREQPAAAALLRDRGATR